MKILFVDDDNISQEMVSLMLSQRGFEVATASNGKEAVDAVKNGAFDLVLMDVQMPVMDGIAATKIIRGWTNGKQNIPILALTASEMVASVQECIQAGMNDFVSKPFSVQQLFHVINSLLEGGVIELGEAKGQLEGTNEQRMVTLDTRTALVNCNNDIIQYKKLLRDFMNALPEKTERVFTSFSSGRTDYVLRLLHNLKGVSATLGAMRFSNAAAQLERSCDLDDVAVIESSLQHFRDLIVELQSQADLYLDETKSSESIDGNVTSQVKEK